MIVTALGISKPLAQESSLNYEWRKLFLSVKHWFHSSEAGHLTPHHQDSSAENLGGGGCCLLGICQLGESFPTDEHDDSCSSFVFLQFKGCLITSDRVSFL